ncbi:hypothetical protein [Microviridae sp.]|nr:hypothetical protein [Microviridae sp.]
MYRPNRTGPWPLINTVATALTTAQVDLSGDSAATPNIRCGDAVLNIGQRANSFDLSVAATQANEQVGFGVQIACPSINGEDTIVSVSGSIVMQTSGGVTPCFVIGRNSGVTAQSDLVNWSLLPLTTQDSGANHQAATINTSIVLGDFLPSGTDSDAPLMAGWSLVNVNGAASNAANIFASVSLHRYISDLTTFDPGR